MARRLLGALTARLHRGPTQREVLMRRLMLLCIPLLLAWSEGVLAQAAPDPTAARASTRLCSRARPKPACSAFVLTNFGIYGTLGRHAHELEPLVADWGLMVNISARDAIGASVFASLENVEVGPFVGFGAAVRYRRWLPSSGSFEVAVGTPLLTTDYIYRRWPPTSEYSYSDACHCMERVAVGTPVELEPSDHMEKGSVFGLVRWSPNNWFAVAARPELLRRQVFFVAP